MNLLDRVWCLVVFMPRVSAFAVVDDRRTFICTAQLHGGVLDLLATTLGAFLMRCALCLQIVLLDGLHARLQLLSQKRWEIGGLCLRDSNFGAGILILGTAALAAQHVSLRALGRG